VVLKGLDINANGGTGVSVTSSVGISLVIEDCTIFNASGDGISFTPQPGTAPSYLFVRNSTIYKNGSGLTAGILIQPGGTAPSIVVLDGVHVNGNSLGVWALDYTNVTIRDSVVSQNTNAGIRADSSVGSATILVEHSQSSHNVNGVVAVGANAVVRISDVTITDNRLNGLITASSGQVISFANNSIAGNANNGTPTSTIPLQ
jgi:hypothetical protein